MLHLSSSKHHTWLIPASLLVGFLWQAWPHEFVFRALKPDAILLATLYWSLRRPHNMNPAVGFVIGLFRDAMEGGLLGQHALSMAITVYLIQSLNRRLKRFSILQQSAVISGLAAVYLLIGNWVHLLTHHADASTHFLLPAISTGLCWPFCFLLLRQLERHPSPRPQ
jgi:rod shape-determining protein MreD